MRIPFFLGGSGKLIAARSEDRDCQPGVMGRVQVLLIAASSEGHDGQPGVVGWDQVLWIQVQGIKQPDLSGGAGATYIASTISFFDIIFGNHCAIGKLSSRRRSPCVHRIFMWIVTGRHWRILGIC